ncbi:MAG: hypothetical protein A2Y40_09380 [Candidatus Margulisbacteria bacterium GWF2_35_9]|nr:MAG: hypothetical protein A2Y40_09380 [Candidatus Margulisbacteria bacterium GWF2_35_9]
MYNELAKSQAIISFIDTSIAALKEAGESTGKKLYKDLSLIGITLKEILIIEQADKLDHLLEVE